MNILVVGDVILDEYVYGKVERISPEAPVPVFDYSGKTEQKLGGAANVAANIRSLSPASKVDLIGYCSFESSKLLNKKIIPLTDRCYDYPAIKKTRYVAAGHQMMRVDYPKKYQCELNVDELTESEFKKYDLIVVSDYDKGTIGTSILSKLRQVSRSTTVLVEAKNARKYFGLSNVIFKCNEKEFEAQKDVLHSPSPFKGLVVTMSEKGYIVYPMRSGETISKPSLISQEDILDVTGAGDVFLAGMAVAYANPCSNEKERLLDACDFANRAAGESVKYFGTVEVKEEWLLKNC
jgi:D-beta-D-heptose 7-phosphate kinase/D-beta-D-heptose 1-phosphate adenosyltransferase